MCDPRELQKALGKTDIVYDKATCGEITYANSLGLISGYVGQEATFNKTADDTQKWGHTLSSSNTFFNTVCNS